MADDKKNIPEAAPPAEAPAPAVENGKQKEYEERTKAKKKAEIEARKQAIRTEDIARGVFIPVSSLPQLGPRKGA